MKVPHYQVAVKSLTQEKQADQAYTAHSAHFSIFPDLNLLQPLVVCSFSKFQWVDKSSSDDLYSVANDDINFKAGKRITLRLGTLWCEILCDRTQTEINSISGAKAFIITRYSLVQQLTTKLVYPSDRPRPYRPRRTSSRPPD